MGSRPPLPEFAKSGFDSDPPHPAELPRGEGGGEEAEEPVELCGLDARRPDAGVLVAEEDVAVVELDGANELLGRPEIRPGEPELQVARLAAAAPALYVGVGESEELQLFYYFVKSEWNPEKDPLLIWLTGGPGCSSWSGLVYEVGPVRYRIEPYNGSLPTLVLNPYSWTKISSIVFVDAPVGTGFSYAKTSSASETGDLKQVQGLFQFFKKWLIDHTEFLSNPIYIAGDSYSGITVPVLVQQISNGIKEGILTPINLQFPKS